MTHLVNEECGHPNPASSLVLDPSPFGSLPLGVGSPLLLWLPPGGARGVPHPYIPLLTFPLHSGFSSEAFQKGGRKGAKKVMIVITDGESHDSPDLEKVIQQSERDNVTRYAVAVSPAPHVPPRVLLEA